ncbi:MAG: copper chaperone PCu(A)C [Telluria sp.]
MGKTMIALAAGALFSTGVQAQVTVSDAWMRATVPQQQSAGAFMHVRSAKAAKLVAVKTPVAANAELHEMQMKGSVMSMHPVQSVALPAGQDVVLGPGGYHVMLFGLKQQLKDGDSVPLTLVVEDAAKKREEVKVAVPVKPIAYQPAK